MTANQADVVVDALDLLLTAVEVPIYDVDDEQLVDPAALPARPYVVRYLDNGDLHLPRQTGRRTAAEFTMPLLIVADSATSARYVSRILLDALERKRPAVAAARATPLRRISASQPIRDKTASATVYNATDTYRFNVHGL